MKATPTHDMRSAALEAFLEERRADGYAVESRTALQAVIVRESRFASVLRLLGRGRDDRRLVVSVDEAGAVAAEPAEPRRW